MNKKRIVVFVRYYLPGYKSGGPVRSISNLVDELADEFDFSVITSDRDALESEPYIGVKIDEWQQVGKAQVFYASPSTLSLSGVRRVCGNYPFDLYYFNSFFDAKFSVLPIFLRKLGILPKKPVVLAPRGEFSTGALGLKSLKKKLFVLFSRALRLHNDIIWHASSEHEREDILRTVGASMAQDIRIAPNLPQQAGQGEISSIRNPAAPSPLKVVFLSRISPKKNLCFALGILHEVRCNVVFDVYGVVDDERHWAECRELIAMLPENIKTTYHGVVSHEQVAGILGSYDLFFLPTLGENYGHAIAESISQGTPVLISDQTPWRNLEREGAGWDLSLGEEAPFVQVIEDVARMDTEAYARLRKTTAEYAARKLGDPQIIESNRSLFWDATQQERV